MFDYKCGREPSFIKPLTRKVSTMVEFQFIVDDSHGWLVVDTKEYPFAKRSATGYGYKNGTTLFLEEDVEATDFLVELRQRGIDFTFAEVRIDGQWEGRNLYEPNK
jgi:hypothetical protein